MVKLDATKKLKSSPNTKLNASIYLALGNVNFISSADFSFKNNMIILFSATCNAMEFLLGWIEQAYMVLLYIFLWILSYYIVARLRVKGIFPVPFTLSSSSHITKYPSLCNIKRLEKLS